VIVIAKDKNNEKNVLEMLEMLEIPSIFKKCPMDISSIGSLEFLQNTFL